MLRTWTDQLAVNHTFYVGQMARLDNGFQSDYNVSSCPLGVSATCLSTIISPEVKSVKQMTLVFEKP
jgi:hypothetical protein